jgi:hypothetical protein
MIKKSYIIPILTLLFLLPVNGQDKKQDAVLKREVTLYNPYKPSLPVAIKRSFLPDMNDTLKVRPEFRYEITTKSYQPEYLISPIKAANLLPDLLPKLYKNYVKIGLGNYVSPLAEISLTNERSKKGAIGLYARHFSTNGKVELQNGKKVFAGYADNDASLFGKKFFRKSVLEGSVDLLQKIRYAYGYDTSITDYVPVKKDIRLGYTNIGAKASLSSLTLDSASFSYDFDVFYNYFRNSKDLFQNNFGLNGTMSKSFKGFYIGSGIGYENFRVSDSVSTGTKYIASISPFIKKSTGQWSFKLGFQAVIDKNLALNDRLLFYPDINFGFSVVPSYVRFFAGLTGKLEKNDPLSIISVNPFLVPDGSLFSQPNTNHKLILTGGLQGNTGIGGNYLVSASYSLINDMIFYTNTVFPQRVFRPEQGNHFIPLVDDIELLKVHGEMGGPINDKISYYWNLNFYKYTLSDNKYPWNKPEWDGLLGLKYNLRDKIIAGMEITAQGKRRFIVNGDLSIPEPPEIEMPAHVNLNFTAEYRYTRVLSVWTKLSNISNNRYYEWAYYPSQRFLCMIGFTYSL